MGNRVALSHFPKWCYSTRPDWPIDAFVHIIAVTPCALSRRTSPRHVHSAHQVEMTFLKKVFGGTSSSPTPSAGKASEAGSRTSCPPSSCVREPASPSPSSPSPLSASPLQEGVSPTPFRAPVDALPPPPPRPTLCLRDFEIQRTLGTGSFGRVMLVRHLPTGQFYAMKKLRKSDVVRLKQVEHTNNERHLLSQVDHPFIVKMLCTFQDERHLYIILEYIAGGELFTLLRKVRVGCRRCPRLAFTYACSDF